jgi:REP-associated tyrosine transposase
MTTLGWHNRHSVRLRDYDYRRAGAYFITVCVQDKRCVLSRIVNDAVMLDRAGRVVQSVWDSLPDRFPGLDVDAFVIMPSHVHGVIVLPDGGKGPLGEVVRTFKAASTRLIRTSGFPDFGWQRSYYEHVIRGEDELERVRAYVVGNPARWETDRENPEGLGTSAKRAR